MVRGTIKLRKQGNSFEKLLKPVLDMEKEWVQVGHFEEQGKHYSGYSYPRLMEIHHDGDDPTGEVEMPPRPLIDYFYQKNLDLKDPRIAKIVSDWGNRPPSEASNKILLNDLGELLAESEKSTFGVSPPLAANAPGKPGGNNPLVDTSDLKNRTSYKTSKTPTPKEVR